MTTPSASDSTDLCVVRRGRIARALSGLGAVAAFSAAQRIGGVPALGLAAIGGLLLGRTFSRHRVGTTARACENAERDVVEQAGHESFPASDPPSWSPTAPGAAAQHEAHD